MGISKARGMAIANRLDGTPGRIFVLTGDGELQEGQFWESLQPTANGEFSEITVIVDHNKMQSDTFVESVSPLGDLVAKIGAFGWAVDRCDGHDPAAIEAALARLDGAGPRPRLLIADTLKGKGVSFMEPAAVGPDGLYAFHSGAPAPDRYQAALEELGGRVDARARRGRPGPLAFDDVEPPARVVPERPQRLIGAYAETLVELGRSSPDVVVLDGDLMVDCGTEPFRREFPDRFVECGIAEQDMVSQAGRARAEGEAADRPLVRLLPVDPPERADLQQRHRAARRSSTTRRWPVCCPPGPATRIRACATSRRSGSVPGLVLIQPGDEAETRLALRWAVEENPESTYLRLTSIPCAIPYSPAGRLPPGAGRGAVLRDGTRRRDHRLRAGHAV